MATEKGSCPNGGNHVWKAVSPGRKQCTKCGTTIVTGAK
jgi:ribosomal protein S27AE